MVGKKILVAPVIEEVPSYGPVAPTSSGKQQSIRQRRYYRCVKMTKVEQGKPETIKRTVKTETI